MVGIMTPDAWFVLGVIGGTVLLMLIGQPVADWLDGRRRR